MLNALVRVIIYVRSKGECLKSRSKGLFMELKNLTICNANTVKPLYILLVCTVFLQILCLVQ